MLDREKMHRLLDAALDIIEGGEGEGGYPYVSINLGNYGTRLYVYVKDDGFAACKKDGFYDGHYSFPHIDTEEKLLHTYQGCMEHLGRLRRRLSMKDIDFERLKNDVRRAVAAYDRYAYVERVATVLGKIDYIAHQYPDASLTAGQVVELFRARTETDEERIV